MSVEKAIWIFLSHSSADFEKVRLIRNYLEEKKCRPLMFYLKCLNSEEETFELIKREIDARTRFVVCDSENARASKWVRKEIEYITAKEPKRSYLELDISKPISDLMEELDAYVNQMNLFISCSRKHYDLFVQIRNRLIKYDLKVLPNMDAVQHGMFFHTEIHTAIRHAANNGYYILLADSSTLTSHFVMEEFRAAVSAKANIVVIALDDAWKQSAELMQYQVLQMDNANQELPDQITDEILWNVLPTGAVYTFANNFRTEKNGHKDSVEADKLDRLLVRKAEASPNPAALVFLARCYENGEHGLPVDLNKALEYYDDAIHSEGRTADLVQHAKELNRHIQQGAKRQCLSLFTKARNLLKKWMARHGQH